MRNFSFIEKEWQYVQKEWMKIRINDFTRNGVDGIERMDQVAKQEEKEWWVSQGGEWEKRMGWVWF